MCLFNLNIFLSKPEIYVLESIDNKNYNVNKQATARQTAGLSFAYKLPSTFFENCAVIFILIYNKNSIKHSTSECFIHSAKKGWRSLLDRQKKLMKPDDRRLLKYSLKQMQYLFKKPTPNCLIYKNTAKSGLAKTKPLNFMQLLNRAIRNKSNS
ncbi:MAG: hypothetical protein L6V88_02685 [Anaerotruncus sp.]|nr:MAG: hypothetical protein L6V88_02685 [Anaerotruncus sp.]